MAIKQHAHHAEMDIIVTPEHIPHSFLHIYAHLAIIAHMMETCQSRLLAPLENMEFKEANLLKLVRVEIAQLDIIAH